MEKVGKQGIIRKQILPFSYSKMPWISSPIDEAGRNHPGIVNREWDSYPKNLACQISQSPYFIQPAATGAKSFEGTKARSQMGTEHLLPDVSLGLKFIVNP